MIAIVFLMIIEVVALLSADIPGTPLLLRLHQNGLHAETRKPRCLPGPRAGLGLATGADLQSDHGPARGSFGLSSTSRTGQ